jgi:uncharacterized protein YraI
MHHRRGAPTISTVSPSLRERPKMTAARLALYALAAAAMLAFAAPDARALEAAASAYLNVRSGPGAGYGVVDVLNPGEVVDVGECRASG